MGFTSFLVESGFVPGALAPIQSWAPWLVRRRMDLEHRWNTTLFHPEKLLEMGMPFVKATLLRDNPGNVDWAPVYRAVRGAGYDLDFGRVRLPALPDRTAPPSVGTASPRVARRPPRRPHDAARRKQEPGGRGPCALTLAARPPVAHVTRRAPTFAAYREWCPPGRASNRAPRARSRAIRIPLPRRTARPALTGGASSSSS